MTLTLPSYGVWAWDSFALQTMSPVSTNQLMSTSPTSSAVYPTASMAIYVPIRVREGGIVRKLAHTNGSAVSGNVDIGLYNASGARLVAAGGVAQSGTSTEQVHDVTDTTIGPGLYYLAVVLDNTTGTLFRDADAAPICAAQGVLTEASAYPLPATATWALNQTLAYYPLLAVLFVTEVS